MKKYSLVICAVLLVAVFGFLVAYEATKEKVIVNPEVVNSEINCNDLSIEECTGECAVCPPCVACSSISCQTIAFCNSIGFEPNWWPDMQAGVDSFTKCAAQGNPVMESYPRQCRAGDKVFTEEVGDIISKVDLVQLDTIRPGDVVTSPLVIEGQARGYWFFEASFPVLLTNWDGLIIAEGIATAEGEWMTEDFVPFSATLEFATPEYGDTGSLILQKDNPSGLPENDDAFEIPIRFR